MGRPTQTGFAVTSNNHRDMRILDRFRIQSAFRQREMIALEGGDFIGPEPFYHLKKFITALTAIFPGIAASQHFFLTPADANTEINTPVA